MVPTYVIVYVRDIDRLRKFYEGIGFRVKSDYGMWVEFDTGSSALALHQVKTPGEETRNLGLFFQVDDVRSLHRRLQGAGFQLSEPAVEDFGFITVQVRDPLGNLLEFGEPLDEDS